MGERKTSKKLGIGKKIEKKKTKRTAVLRNNNDAKGDSSWESSIHKVLDEIKVHGAHERFNKPSLLIANSEIDSSLVAPRFC